MRIEVSQLPPVESSPNWRGFWAERYKAAKIYHSAVFYSCVDARNKAYIEGWPLLPFIKARLNLTFVFAEQRRRDEDNLRARFKPGQDALVDSALVIDDDVEHLQPGEIKIEVDKSRAPLTIIELQEV